VMPYQVAVRAGQRPLYAAKVHPPTVFFQAGRENTRKTVFQSLRNDGHDLNIFLFVLQVNQH
jgi:hypothetical protein